MIAKIYVIINYNRTKEEILKHNAVTMTEYHILFGLREAKDTTEEEITQIDDFLSTNYNKYIFNK